MEAPRGAREPTGTNGPTLTNTSTTLVDRHHLECSSNHYTDHNQHNPHTLGDTRILVEPLVVVIAAGKRPASIPNLEAKPASADGTAPGRVWESRTPPQHSIQAGGARNTIVPSPTRLLCAGPPVYTTTLSLRASTPQNPTTHSQSALAALGCATVQTRTQCVRSRICLSFFV